MKRKIKYGTIAGVCALGMIGLNSCLKMDEAYDLEKDIDMTVTMGGNLTIPGSSTEKMKLKDLLDMEEDGVVVANEITGDYSIVQEGEKNSTTVQVPEVTVDMTGGFEGAEFSFNVPQLPGLDENSFVEETFDEIIKINVSQGDITSDIRKLNNAVTNCVETYLVFSKIGYLADVELMQNFSIEFPDYITVESEDANWKAEGNKLILTKTDGLEVTATTRVKFQIVKVNFVNTDAVFTPGNDENGVIDLGGEIILNGRIKATARSTQGGDMALRVDVESDLMNIESVVAVVDPKVDIEIKPIELNDMPDFLTENEVMLDLTDPRVFITLSNPSPLAVELSGTLIARKTDKEDKMVDIPVITVPDNNTEFKICINQIKDGLEGDINYVKVEGLSSIIENIPEEIEMTEVKTQVVQEPVTINLGEEFTVETDYRIDTPLMFGPRTTINYSEAIDGWDADLEDAEFSCIEASMVVINEIPLGISLTADAIDKEGNKLSNVTVDMNANVKSGSMGNPTSQEVVFSVTTSDGNIKGLDGIKLYIKANASENTSSVALNENQSIQITDLKLSLKGGITMDLN